MSTLHFWMISTILGLLFIFLNWKIEMVSSQLVYISKKKKKWSTPRVWKFLPRVVHEHAHITCLSPEPASWERESFPKRIMALCIQGSRSLILSWLSTNWGKNMGKQIQLDSTIILSTGHDHIVLFATSLSKQIRKLCSNMKKTFRKRF